MFRDLAPLHSKLGFTWHGRAAGSESHVLNSAQENIDAALKFLPKGCRRTAVQAGGHCGLWPHRLGAEFERVYTFEPDADNFRCLAMNAPGWNVYPFRATLGPARASVGLEVTKNSGSNKVQGYGAVPMLALDDFSLDAVDLIALDVEGFEYFVLTGALDTITRCQPLIMLEELKREVEFQGNKAGIRDAWSFLTDRGYRKVGAVNKDGIWGLSTHVKRG